jgi:hypothetical protein
MYWLGKWAYGSKLAILSAHPDTAKQLYIVNEHLGDWSDVEPGVWYSNSGHLEAVQSWFSSDPRKGSKLYGATKPGEVEDVLEVEDAFEVEDVLGRWDPWAYFEDGDKIAECAECGELWPAWVDWCDECGSETLWVEVEGGPQ